MLVYFKKFSKKKAEGNDSLGIEFASNLDNSYIYIIYMCVNIDS